jgi:YVTN family beta-propeller protein
MRATFLAIACLIAISLITTIGHAQQTNIIATQHVFTNVTATFGVPCDFEPYNAACWRVTGTVAQPQFCTTVDDSSGTVQIIIVQGFGVLSARVVGLTRISPTDCSFSLVALPFFGPGSNLDSGNVVTQDGLSYGIISVVHPAYNAAWETCTGGPCPTTSLTSPLPTTAYVTNVGSNTVSVINTSTNSVIGTVPVGPNPVSIAVSPSASTAYVTNAGSNSVSVIDTGALTVIKNVTVGGNPLSIVMTPDGTQAYVANARSNSVSVINTATNTVTATIAVGFAPLKLAMTADGASVYVANSGAKSLSVISTATNTVVATVPVGVLPSNLAIN